MDSKETLLRLLKEHGIEVTEAEPGQGGIFITEKGIQRRVEVSDILPEFYKDPNSVIRIKNPMSPFKKFLLRIKELFLRRKNG